MPVKIDTFIAPPCHEEISILFQDEHLLLINKPSGLLSLSGKNPLNKDSVHYRLVQNFSSATLVHRLDFGTSGIMIVALSKAINAEIGKQFHAGLVHKTYTAILYGHLTEDRGLIEYPIAKDIENFPLQKICYAIGKKAITQYKVIERLDNPLRSRVEFTPFTGRTHQLRIHSRELGHPILGCDLYKNSQSCSFAPRLLLHATTLEFIHPVTQEKLKHTCACSF